MLKQNKLLPLHPLFLLCCRGGSLCLSLDGYLFCSNSSSRNLGWVNWNDPGTMLAIYFEQGSTKLACGFFGEHIIKCEELKSFDGFTLDTMYKVTDCTVCLWWNTTYLWTWCVGKRRYSFQEVIHHHHEFSLGEQGLFLWFRTFHSCPLLTTFVLHIV